MFHDKNTTSQAQKMVNTIDCVHKTKKTYSRFQIKINIFKQKPFPQVLFIKCHINIKMGKKTATKKEESTDAQFLKDFKKLGKENVQELFEKYEKMFLDYDSDATEDDEENLFEIANKIKDEVTKKDKPKPKLSKIKKKRKSSKPSKPIPSYFIYNKEKYPETKEKYPELTPGEIKKKISQMWKSMDEEEKKPYNQKASDEKEKYNKLLEKYNEEHSGNTSEDESDGEPVKKKKTRDPNKPKKYITAFFLFCKHKREQLKEQDPQSSEKPTQTSKKSSIEWRAMTDEEKKPYLEEEAVLKSKYLKAMEEYNKTKQ